MIPQTRVRCVQVMIFDTVFEIVVVDGKDTVGDLLVFGVAPGLVAVAGLADPKGLTSRPDRQPALLHGSLCHLAPARWLHRFFARASATTSALSMRAMSEASMPPYLARHL